MMYPLLAAGDMLMFKYGPLLTNGFWPGCSVQCLERQKFGLDIQIYKESTHGIDRQALQQDRS